MYYHFLGGITTETNFDLILSSPDDECFQIVILFLIQAQCVYSSLKNRITEHYPGYQYVNISSFAALGIKLCSLPKTIGKSVADSGYAYVTH